MLGSANLGPSVFWGFYCNFVNSGPLVTKFGATNITNKCCKFKGYTASNESGATVRVCFWSSLSVRLVTE